MKMPDVQLGGMLFYRSTFFGLTEVNLGNANLHANRWKTERLLNALLYSVNGLLYVHLGLGY